MILGKELLQLYPPKEKRASSSLDPQKPHQKKFPFQYRPFLIIIIRVVKVKAKLMVNRLLFKLKDARYWNFTMGIVNYNFLMKKENKSLLFILYPDVWYVLECHLYIQFSILYFVCVTKVQPNYVIFNDTFLYRLHKSK